MNDVTMAIDPRNSGQLRTWDGEHGAYWAEHADTYDHSYADYQPALLAAISAQPGERVLDVGCGSGELAIDIVRSVPGASAVGVDLSNAQLDVARGRAGGVATKFVQADAQLHDFGEAAYDVVASRTGTMFFSDPGMAFANLARATRPGGRLVMFVWRGIEDNEWLREFTGAIGRVLPLDPPPADAPGPFALSDPSRVRDLLEGGGWAEVAFAAHDAQLWFGADADRATTFMVGQMAWLFAKLDEGGKRQAESNLRAVMADHEGADGVRLGSGAWIVTARRPS
ncbi:methyltransferase domain-containing protein [Kribbella capetownensis]|uniref:Methyltransferase domain-containing protein n=1 Tax=Kribbella capetownensis TaxID=1572659 RepID=A0A4R0JVB1_9ACTN|nr:class I SAM-dependent methyltransferase [Kribbella capetownensis]TCC49128.1 methyltransferase domain-containing protein [Kribbella capetownensis]